MKAKTSSRHQVSILLFDTDSKNGKVLQTELSCYGYQVLARLDINTSLLAGVELHKPDIVMLSIQVLNKDIISDMQALNSADPHPIVIFAEQDSPQIIEQAIKAGVSAYVVDDIQPHRLSPIINVAIARFSELRKIKNELEQTKSKLAGRKIIDKAKGLMMEKKNISEDDAYKHLRKMAMDKGESLEKTAQNIIDVLSMFDASA